MILVFAAIGTAALLKVVVASLVGGVVIATAFSVFLYGPTSSSASVVTVRRPGPSRSPWWPPSVA